MKKYNLDNKEILLREKEFSGSEFHSSIESLLPMLKFDSNNILNIYNFYKYISSLEYHHPGLTRQQYMTHPVRVAKLVIQFHKNYSSKEIMLALSHNVLEVAKINLSKIDNDCFLSLIPYIEILTVDRELQWDHSYKVQYYAKIKKQKITSIIKVLDKVDNLFLLKNNPSSDIKIKYLNEIKEFVVPLAECYLPLSLELISNLIIYNENILSEEI